MRAAITAQIFFDAPAGPTPVRWAARLTRHASWAAACALALVLGPACDTAIAGTLLPERGGSPNADRIASLYTVVLVLAALVFAGVAAALVFALIRYREDRSPIAAQIRGNTRLEIGWTLAATALIVFIAVFSLTRLGAIEHPDRIAASPESAAAASIGHGPGDALHIRVVGRQYIWMFQYPNGAFSYQELVVPVGVTVELAIVSTDVAHSWWIPKLGGKFDAVPGYVSRTWFRIKADGVYRGQCAELCGRNHADMVAQVRAVQPAAYASWLAEKKREIAAANALRDERPEETPAP